MALDTTSRRKRDDPPLDNSRLIADIITLAKEGVAMAERSAKAGVAQFYTILRFESEVEERHVRLTKTTTKLSSVVFGRITICLCNKKDDVGNPFDSPAWIVSIGTNAYMSPDSLIDEDDERDLPSCAEEIAAAIGARNVPFGPSLRLYIPIVA